MKNLRKPTSDEFRLIKKLVELSIEHFNKEWEEEIWVESMINDGMGGLYLYPNPDLLDKRKFGKEVSSLEFLDIDGVPIIASLYLDNFGNLLELDIFKVDYTMMKKIPDL